MEDDLSKSSSKGCHHWLRRELRIKKELLPIKIVTFLYQGGIVAYMPFLTLHMMGMGITMTQIGFTYACMPFASIIGPPIAGILADRFGNYKLVLIMVMFMTAGLHHMLLYVPYNEPERISLSCGPGGYNLTSDSYHHCIQKNNYTLQGIHLKDCKFTCEEPDQNVNVCYNDDICLTYNSTQKVSFNISIALASENDDQEGVLDHIERVNYSRQPLTCSNHCRLNCQISGVADCVTKEFSLEYTFWIYLSTRLLATLFLGPSFTMLDASALALVKEHKGEFGKQRITGMIGGAVIPLLAGILVDFHSNQLGYQEFMSAFYLGNGLILIGIICLAFMTVKVEAQRSNFWADLKKLVSRIEIDIFLFMILLLGTSWGFIEMFLFIRLKELGATNFLMGLTMTVGFGVSLPFLFIADAIIEKVGRPSIFTLSFFMYGVRLIGYSLITNPWMCFPFEFLEVITFQLTWVAAVTYCPILAPKSLLATMTGLIGATHYSIGRGIGSFLGGFVIEKVGAARGFQIFGCIAIGGGFLYVLLHNLFLKHKINQAEKTTINQSDKEVDNPMLSTDSVLIGRASIKQEKTMMHHRLNTLGSKYNSEQKNNEKNIEYEDNHDALNEEHPMLLRGLSEKRNICIAQKNGRIKNSLNFNNGV